jgi:hypothetical protein
MEEARLVSGIAAQPAAPAPVAECVAALKRQRYERERSEVQARITALQSETGQDAEMAALDERKMELVRRIAQLST